MKTIFYSGNVFFQRKYRLILLILYLVTGSLIGVFCAIKSRADLIPLMHGITSASVSIVRMVFAILLPFFAVILAGLYNKQSALLPICFLKLFCFSFSMMGICLAFGSSSWMVCGLLMFSDAVSVLLLIKLSIRHASGFLPSFGSELFQSLILIVGIGMLDCFCIAPFLVRIISN